MSEPLINFSPGPAAVPTPVKARIREEAFDWGGPGVSVMEVSHRGQAFMALAEDIEARLRELLAVPDAYRVLFLQGGASTQFALVPLNLAAEDQPDPVYLTDGHWGEKAHQEASRLRTCQAAHRGDSLPAIGAYLHTTSNETIEGRQWREPPVTQLPVVCDMSSDILSRRIEVGDYGLIYAGAQKNIGIAGLTLVLVAPHMLERSPDALPTMLNYRRMAEADSMANTPPTFAWYVCGLVLEWIEGLGGLEAVERRNRAKADLVYGAIDGSDFYRSDVPTAERSLMNPVFRLPDERLERRFVAEAEAEGMLGLKGHRAVGGLRASLYNAIEIAEVATLVAFMAEFERRA